MPNTPSAKKRLKQNIVRRARNRSTKAQLKGLTRKVRDAVTAGKLDEAATAFRAATKELDQAASAKVIHRNAAARTKSRLSASIKAAGKK